VEILVEYPASMTHSMFDEDQLAEAGISRSLVCVSVGTEDIDDLLADVDQAFAAIS
jgi:cystathionine beta-lyase/cystathionine gamma-synthase